ncbi:type II toxin-antitoxin system RelE/ParE family toxin [Methanolapillus millepedarum]|uniref:Type II toxin-antitoxin system RelE/ParE family toxin n=1 Tax=Methanolapillus millepedarum TaxID=3028296 RepID=A0AA97A428_9EURY|nr:hypothetical protein MsAc7_10600 [Methanosarcinaceae archaeon Ac7]
MAWKIEFLKESIHDLEKLDKTIKNQILKAIKKISENPLPHSEGGYGKPLENQKNTKLSGCFKIRVGKHRVIYKLIREETTMEICVISIRDDGLVYEIAEKRVNG